jgi:hypothetical protein
VNSYGYQPENELCYIAALRLEVGVSRGEVSLSLFHLIEFVFSRWPLRKVYLELPEFNLRFVDASLGFVREEGRLDDYVFFNGRWWDRVFLSISKSSWESFAKEWRPLMREGFAFDDEALRRVSGHCDDPGSAAPGRA